MNLKEMPTDDLIGTLVAGCAQTTIVIEKFNVNSEVDREILTIMVGAVSELTEEFESRDVKDMIYLGIVSASLIKVMDAIACVPNLPTNILESILNIKQQ